MVSLAEDMSPSAWSGPGALARVSHAPSHLHKSQREYHDCVSDITSSPDPIDDACLERSRQINSGRCRSTVQEVQSINAISHVTRSGFDAWSQLAQDERLMAVSSGFVLQLRSLGAIIGVVRRASSARLPSREVSGFLTHSHHADKRRHWTIPSRYSMRDIYCVARCASVAHAPLCLE